MNGSSSQLTDHPLVIRAASTSEALFWASLKARRVIVCLTDGEFVDAIQRQTIGGIVWQITRGTFIDPEVVRAVVRAARRAPTVVRAEISPRTAETILTVALAVPMLRVSLSLFDDPKHDVDWLKAGAPTSGEHLVLKRVAGAVEPRLSDVVVASVVGGRQRLTVERLADICDTAARTLQHHVSGLSALTPNRLIGWGVSLQIAWRLQENDESVKLAAFSTGFSTSADLSNYLWRHVGLRPVVIRRESSFWQLLEQFADLIRRSP